MNKQDYHEALHNAYARAVYDFQIREKMDLKERLDLLTQENNQLRSDFDNACEEVKHWKSEYEFLSLLVRRLINAHTSTSPMRSAYDALVSYMESEEEHASESS